MATIREVQKAVDDELRIGNWPIYRTEDDNGLEEEEYLKFVLSIMRRLAIVQTN